jgi:hypothetical protein
MGGFGEIGLVCANGQKKYGTFNYVFRGKDDAEKRYSETGLLSAVLRHVNERLMGIDKDAESGLDPLAHAAWNILALLDLKARGILVMDIPRQGSWDWKDTKKPMLVASVSPRCHICGADNCELVRANHDHPWRCRACEKKEAK